MSKNTTMTIRQCEKCLSFAVMPAGVCLNCGFLNDSLDDMFAEDTQHPARKSQQPDNHSDQKSR